MTMKPPKISPMNRSSMARNTTFSWRKTNSSPSNTIMWSNLAFISDNDDECSSVGSNNISSSPMKDKGGNSCFPTRVITEEELKLREELGKEIEKELEREIMEGILVLVHRLSDLKAKQITRGLRNIHLDQFLSELYSSNCCTLCKIGGHVSPWHTSHDRSPKNKVRQPFGENVGEKVCEGSDMESTIGKWSYWMNELKG